MKIMFLWSGGIESTSTIKHYLEHSTHDVYVHYISHNSSEGRQWNEDAAVKSLLPHLQAIRPFHFSRSSLSLIGGAGLARDLQVMYPIGLVAMRHFECVQLNRGLCAEDNWHRMEGRSPLPAWGKDGNHRHVILREVLRPLLEHREHLEHVAPVLPEYEWPKARHYYNLGSLAEMTWSCRRPVMLSQCGKCHACVEREAASKGMSSIPEVQASINRDSSWRS